MAAVDGAEVAAVEAAGFWRQDKRLSGIETPAAARPGQRPSRRIGGPGVGYGAPIDGDDRSMSTDDVAGLARDPLDEEGGGRQVAAGVRQRQKRLGQADDGQRARWWRARCQPVDAGWDARADIPKEGRSSGFRADDRENGKAEQPLLSSAGGS